MTETLDKEELILGLGDISSEILLESSRSKRTSCINLWSSFNPKTFLGQ
jgi:hypothetical protein